MKLLEIFQMVHSSKEAQKQRGLRRKSWDSDVLLLVDEKTKILVITDSYEHYEPYVPQKEDYEANDWELADIPACTVNAKSIEKDRNDYIRKETLKILLDVIVTMDSIEKRLSAVEKQLQSYTVPHKTVFLPKPIVEV